MDFQVGPLRLIDRQLFLDGKPQPIKLFPMEARLLAVLMRHPDQLVSRETLMREVWQTDYLTDTRTLDVHICTLRRKVEPDPARPRLIRTYRGAGYWFCAPRSPP